MIPAIVIFPVIALIGAFCLYVRKYKVESSFLLATWTAIRMFFIALVGAVFTLMLTPKVYSDWAEHSKVKIVAMTKSDGSNDTFLELLKIKGDQYYVLYEKSANDKTLTFIKKSSVTIHEDASEGAYIVRFNRGRVLNKSWWFNFLVPAFLRPIGKFLRPIVKSTVYVIHIPKGSIKSEINLSLPKG